MSFKELASVQDMVVVALVTLAIVFVYRRLRRRPSARDRRKPDVDVTQLNRDKR